MTWKRYAFIFAIVLLTAILSTRSAGAIDLILRNAPAQVYFSPDSGASQAVIKEIDNAATEILVQAHSLADPNIADALAGAKKRAVSVEVILDKGGRSGKYTSALANMKIPVYIDSTRARNDMMLIDKTTVISGSLDFRKDTRDSAAGNLLIVKSKELASPYLDNWLKHKQHSGVFHQKKEPPRRKR